MSHYQIEDEEYGLSKAITIPLSTYSTKDLEELPNSKRLTLWITVPYDISKVSLSNTLKSILNEQISNDDDIDEIVIFAYNNKNDIGIIQYTFGKLIWAPNAKTDNVTPEIAKHNYRDKHEIDIIIKNKVGEINTKNIPTPLELEIYNEIMLKKYWDMKEDEYEKIIMKKFNISKKELDEAWLKVAAYKN